MDVLSKYEVVIGLEIHVQIAVKTKMFCACGAEYFGKTPNVNVCEVCLGFPGQLPVANAEALKNGLRAAVALNAELAEIVKFDRKNYFYPDLPKGFQLTQFFYPMGKDGFLEITLEDGSVKRIGINRLHVEEDAGKLTHVQGMTLVDFNRSGVPLLEIVSEPQIGNAKEASAYAKAIQMIMRYAEVADCDMEKGQMRFDASVSLRPKGDTKLYPRAEVKNLNSFRALEQAINFEIKRQADLWEAGKPQDRQYTMGYDEINATTYVLREKESSNDYRYFAEPDLPPVFITKEWVQEAKSNMPEMPGVKYRKYIDELGLSEAEALFLIEDRVIGKFFDEVYSLSGDAKKTATMVLSVLPGLMKKEMIGFEEMKLGAGEIAGLIKKVNSGDLNLNQAKGEVMEEMLMNGKSLDEVIKEKGFGEKMGDEELNNILKDVLSVNEQSVVDYRAGKEKAFQFLVGQGMKQTKGKVNPGVLQEKLRALLA